jgi:hypothetical protein
LVLPTLAVILVIAGLVYGGSARRGKRYRPGRPFEFRPVWFLSSPEQLSGNALAAALPAAHRPELPAAEAPALAQPEAARQTGGASDRW